MCATWDFNARVCNESDPKGTKQKGGVKMDAFEVAVCQRDEWDWQSALYFHFLDNQKAFDFMTLCLEQGMLVQIKKYDPDEQD